MYRFLSNEKVTEQELIESVCECSSRLSEGRHVLVLNDTTEINLQSHAGRVKPDSGLGLVGNNTDIGYFAHLGLVIDVAANQAIGFSSIQLWHRATDKGTKESRGYGSLPVEEKESYKWIQCAQTSKSQLPQALSITIVGDRESDMYELFTDAQKMDIHVIARNRINRKTEEGKKLYEILSATPTAGEYEIELDGDIRKQKRKRKAKLDVKYSQVEISKPLIKVDERQQSIKVWVVEAKETSRTEGICWRILTTHPITDLEKAIEIIACYKMRWFIEEVFRLLKNKGLKIEDSELETGWAIRKLTVLLLHNILRVMQMLIAYSASEEQDAGLVFNATEIKFLAAVCKTKEGKTAKLQNQHKPQTLKWATWIIARLGGWSGYQSQRPPGPITLKNGLDVFELMLAGYLIAKDVGTQ